LADEDNCLEETMKKAKILYVLILLGLLIMPLNSAASNTEPDQVA
jgi:hypothetical protein